jgi:molybdenum cofactor cytidylyltransferase
MRFGPVPLEEAEGKLLAHNISDTTGRRVLRKGRTLDAAALELLAGLGHARVFVAELDDGDVHEDEAAERIARVVAGSGVEASSPHTGRVNVTAPELGVVYVDTETLFTLNGIEGVTVATLRTHTLVRPRARVATVKIIPYALPPDAVRRAESSGGTGVVSVRPIPPSPVAVVLTGGRGGWETLRDGLGAAIEGRMRGLGCPVSATECVALDEGALAEALAERARGEVGLVVVAGETAIMDVDDLIPRGIRRAGGEVEHLGLPMDPGHLLLLGYLKGVPVVGAPGCVRGTVPDGFDAVVPRLLAGERLGRADLEALGHGGLLSDPRAR